MKKTRKEIQETALVQIAKLIEKYGEDSIYVKAPQPEKNTWTYGELYNAVLNDEPLKNNSNPIDDMIKLYEFIHDNE